MKKYRITKIKDFGGTGKYWQTYKGSAWEPAEYEGEVYSSYSGDVIENDEDCWADEFNSILHKEEAMAYFFDDDYYVKHINENDEEYEKAKKSLMEKYGYKEEDFKNAKLIKVVETGNYYDINNEEQLEKALNEGGYRYVGFDSSLIDWEEAYDEPDPDD